MRITLFLIYSYSLLCFISCNKKPIPDYSQRTSYFKNVTPVHWADSILTCVTFNIHLGFKASKNPWNKEVSGASPSQVEAIANILESIDADIIALQEVPRNRYNAEIPLFLEALANRLNMNYAFGANGYNDPYDIYPVYGEWGNAILTKYEIQSIHNEEVEYVSQWERRSMLDAQVRLNDSSIVHALSLHHLPSPAGVTNTKNYLQNIQEPIILMGDFNRVGQNIDFNAIGLTDVDSNYTTHRIDRIFINKPKMQVLSIGSLDDTARTSDHPANYCTLKVKN